MNPKLVTYIRRGALVQRGGQKVDAEEVIGPGDRSNVTIVQDRINENLSEEIQAKLGQARSEAKANEIRQRGYENCPTCARIDAIKSLPQGLTALGGDLAVGVSR